MARWFISYQSRLIIKYQKRAKTNISTTKRMNGKCPQTDFFPFTAKWSIGKQSKLQLFAAPKKKKNIWNNFRFILLFSCFHLLFRIQYSYYLGTITIQHFIERENGETIISNKSCVFFVVILSLNAENIAILTVFQFNFAWLKNDSFMLPRKCF